MKAAQLLLGFLLGFLVNVATMACSAAEPVQGRTEACWPQWRGPTRDGQSHDPIAWPRELNEQFVERVWRVPLAESYSGPIVTDRLVFVTETRDKKQEVVQALDRTSGRAVWEQSWEGSLAVPFFARENGDWIRATPAYDGQSLYVAGMRDVLVCLAADSGAVRWRRDFVAELKAPPPAFGFVSSPLIDGDFVYVQAGASCLKLDKATGATVWRSLEDAGGMWGSAFSSPLLAELAGRRQLLVQTRDKLAGLDPDSGKPLWSQDIPAFRGMNILTPLAVGDAVFTSAYRGKSMLFTLKQQADQLAPQQTWTNKSTGYMSTPVVIGGHLYLHLQNQRFTCLDLATGETCWTSRPFGKYWSLVAQGDQVLALDERGDLHLIRANPEKFELLGTYHVTDESTWAHLAVCGQDLFIRELNALSVLRWRTGTAPQAVGENR